MANNEAIAQQLYCTHDAIALNPRPKPVKEMTKLAIDCIFSSSSMSYSRLLSRSFTTSLHLNSSSDAIKAISSDLYKERNFKLLVEKFKKSSDLYRFRTCTGIYEDTVRRLASAKLFRWIEDILEHQKNYPDISKEGFSARLIALYGKSGMFESAQKVFDEMPERNCERTILSFNALLGAGVKSRKYDLVDKFFKELPAKLSIEPDVVSYNTIIKAYCGNGSFDSAISMLDEMEKRKVEPDLITFNTLFYCFYTNGRFLEAEQIWNRLEKTNLTPDIRSYNAKLNGLALEKKMEDAVKLFEEMKTKEIKPDVFTFNALLNGYVKEGKLEEAKQWFTELEKTEIAPQKTTYATMIPFLCEKGDLAFAHQLCNDIFKRRKLVDSSVLQTVVDELVKCSRIEDAKEIVRLGKTNNYRLYRLTLPAVK